MAEAWEDFGSEKPASVTPPTAPASQASTPAWDDFHPDDTPGFFQKFGEDLNDSIAQRGGMQKGVLGTGEGPVPLINPITKAAATVVDSAYNTAAVGIPSVLEAGFKQLGEPGRQIWGGIEAALNSTADLAGPAVGAQGARVTALQKLFQENATVDKILEFAPDLDRKQVKAAVEYRDAGGEGASFVPVDAAKAIDDAKGLRMDAQNFKGTPEPRAEDLFKATPEPDLKSLEGRLAAEAEKFKTEPSAPVPEEPPYVTDISPVERPDTVAEDTQTLSQHGLTPSHFASDADMTDAVDKLFGRRPPEQASFDGEVSSPLPEADPTLTKKTAESEFQDSLVAAKPQTPAQWKAALEKSAKDFTNSKEPSPEAIQAKSNDPFVNSAKVEEPEVPSAPDEVITKMTSILKDANKLTKPQQALYAKNRSERVAKGYAIPAEIQGKDRYYAKLAALSGKMDKVQFTPIEDHFSPGEIKTLFDHVEGSNLTFFGKLAAQKGLSKLLDGSIPASKELSYLGDVFPRDFVKAALDKNKKSKGVGILANALGTIRQMKATVDLSMPGMQGWGFLSHPEFYKALGPMLKEAYKGLTKDPASYLARVNKMKADPFYQKLKDAGVSFTDALHSGAGEEAHASGYADKIPLFSNLHSASEKGATTFLNELRLNVGKKFWENAEKQGIDTDSEHFQQSLASIVNTLSGRGDLGRFEPAAGAAATALFSPRFVASRVNMLNPVYYKNLHPAMRNEMGKSMAGAAAISTGLVGIAAALGADVTVDPRSSDFGKIKVGNSRYSMFGGLSNYATLATRLGTNEATNQDGVTRELGQKYGDSSRADVFGQFLSNKTAPIPNYVLRYWKGKNIDGSEFKPVKEAVGLMIPMYPQAQYDAMVDSGVPEGFLKALPGLFGWDVSTYSPHVSKTDAKAKAAAEGQAWNDFK